MGTLRTRVVEAEARSHGGRGWGEKSKFIAELIIMLSAVRVLEIKENLFTEPSIIRGVPGQTQALKIVSPSCQMKTGMRTQIVGGEPRRAFALF